MTGRCEAQRARRASPPRAGGVANGLATDGPSTLPTARHRTRLPPSPDGSPTSNRQASSSSRPPPTWVHTRPKCSHPRLSRLEDYTTFSRRANPHPRMRAMNIWDEGVYRFDANNSTRQLRPAAAVAPARWHILKSIKAARTAGLSKEHPANLGSGHHHWRWPHFERR